MVSSVVIKEPIVLPWVEKYRPNSLEDLVSHDEIITTLNKFLNRDRLPHLLLYGPPGTGKTSAILAICKQIYEPKEINSMVLELNASDDRGIGIVRGPILNFASTKSIFKTKFKFIILDEADAMTNDAQNALRRIIEKYTENVRFCLICNYLNKIIPALQSRCTRFRFGPLSSVQISPRLEHVIEEEKVNVTADGKKALIDLAQGDMRKVLNILQCTSMAFDVINETNVYLCCGYPLKEDIKDVLESLLNEDFRKSYQKIYTLQREKGIALQDIITQIHNLIHKIEFPSNVKLTLLEQMADVEFMLSSGGNERILISAFVSCFQSARDSNLDKMSQDT